MAKMLLAALALAALLHAQDSRIAVPAPPPESRPASSIYVLASGDKGDQIIRVNAATLAVIGTADLEGSPSYAHLTPDGEELIFTTTRRGPYSAGGVTVGLDPQTLAERWTRRTDSPLSWRGQSSYPVVTDPTVPDTVGFLHLASIPGSESRSVSPLLFSAGLVRRGGVITSVPLPEETRHLALLRKENQTSIIGLTARNEVWEIDAATGEARQITKRQIAPSSWLQPTEEGGIIVNQFLVAQSGNRGVCFTKKGDCFVVDLATGEVSRPGLPKLLRESGIAFGRYCEKARRYLVCSDDVPCGGHVLFMLDAVFEEVASTAIVGDPFIDAVFAPDGSCYATLTAGGWLEIDDGARSRKSPAPLPSLGNNGMHCASILGWR